MSVGVVDDGLSVSSVLDVDVYVVVISTVVVVFMCCRKCWCCRCLSVFWCC